MYPSIRKRYVVTFLAFIHVFPVKHRNVFHMKHNLLYFQRIMAKTQKQTVGDLGESLAVRFLVKHGYLIVLRNYLKSVGEIDIICRKRNKLYFVEVKTVSRETETNEDFDAYRPEDNIHEKKLKRMGRAVQMYLEESNTDYDWELMGVLVVLDKSHKIAKISVIEDLVL